MDYQVDQVELEEQPTAVVRAVVPETGISDFLGGAFGEVMTVLEAQGLHPAGPPFGCYVPTPAGFEVEAGFPSSGPVEPAGRVVPSVLPGGPALAVLHVGPYDGVVGAYHAAELWFADSEWEAAAPPWETYLDGPEVAEPRTVVHVPRRHR